MGGAVPIITSIVGGFGLGQALFGGQEAPGADIPSAPESKSNAFEDQQMAQRDKNQVFRRQAASKSKKLTALSDSSTGEDSLLRIVAGGK